MTEVFMSAMVVLVLALGTALVARSVEASMRSWVWLGFLEYMACAVAQMLITRVINPEGGDTILYTDRGGALAKYLDQAFMFTAPEVLRLLFQQPSGVDNVAEIVGSGSNTGSMFAITAFLMFFLAGSALAVQFLITGFAFFGTLQIYKALHDAQPEVSPQRLFMATVMFPSVAFWTAAVHKESFCMMGIGCCFAAWRAIYRQKWLRVLLLGPLGVTVLALYRAPVLPPIALGLAVYFIFERLRKARGGDVVILGPIYLVVGFLLVAGGMVLVSQLDPSLALDRLGDTMGRKQALWGRVEAGSTMLDEEDVLPATPAEQLAHVPLALLNALFRPQFFDVHNFGTFLSAIEMTTVTWLLIRSIRQSGFRGFLNELQKSPLLLMCAVIAFVGCTFVGLVTYNLGSLARYRVPFLPFYATVIVFLLEKGRGVVGAVAKPRSAPAKVPATKVPALSPAVRKG
jgi:hypothetical protein